MATNSSLTTKSKILLCTGAGAAVAGIAAFFLYCRHKGHHLGSSKEPTSPTTILPSKIVGKDKAKKGGAGNQSSAQKSAGATGSGAFSEKAKSARVHVVFGSATGTAEAFARTCSQDTRERGCPVALWDAEEFYEEYFSTALIDRSSSPSSSIELDDPFQVVLFIVATTGDGEPTDNFRKMYDQFLRYTKPEQQEELKSFAQRGTFSSRSFAVFGLGDTSYKYYNKVGVDVDEWLGKQFGARRIAPIGLGDAKDPSQEDVFDTWKELVWEALDTQCGITLSEASSVPRALEQVFMLEDESAASFPATSGTPLNETPPPTPQSSTTPTTRVAGAGEAPSSGSSRSPQPFLPPPSHLEPSLKHPLMVTVLQKKELLTPKEIDEAPQRHLDNGEAPEFCESTLLIEISIEGSGIVYQGGDHCAIFPSNPRRVVDGYLDALRVSPSDAAKLVKLCSRVNSKARASLQNTLPGHVSMRLALTHYFDLCGKVRKSTLRQLARFCTDEHERQTFNALIASMSTHARLVPCSPANDGAVLPDWRSFRTVLDYLRCFKSCVVPLAHFFELMPRLQPRYYSIASDQLTHKSSIQLIIKMEEGGLTSEFLSHSVQVGDAIPIFVRKSSFHLPLGAKTRPVVMIGPGTGVAPLLGFCYRRRGWIGKNFPIGEGLLFFGCRRRDDDDIAADFISSFLQGGELTFAVTAYSREQAEKVYVQHLIREHAPKIAELLLKKEGAVYICGDASRMAKDVEKALLEEVLVKAGGLSMHVAKLALKRMEKSDRFLKDVW